MNKAQLNIIAAAIMDQKRGLTTMAEYQMWLYDFYRQHIDNQYYLHTTDDSWKMKALALIDKLIAVDLAYAESESFYQYISQFDVSSPYITLEQLEIERNNSNKYDIWLEAKYTRLNQLIVESGLTS